MRYLGVLKQPCSKQAVKPQTENALCNKYKCVCVPESTTETWTTPHYEAHHT